MNNLLHIYPLHDIKRHELEHLDCGCFPRIDWKRRIVYHNYFRTKQGEIYVRTKNCKK